MRLLLDTQAVIWWVRGQGKRFGEASREVLWGGSAEIVVSAATVWEASIKHAKGKLPEAGGLLETLERSDVALLEVTARHADRAGRLMRHHGDPFDRLLIAQAQMEGLTLVSSDRLLASYGVEILW